MSLISKIKEALGITAMEAAQAEARREATAARKAAAERDERLFALMDRLHTQSASKAHIPSSDREAELINQIAALQSEIKQLQEEKEATSKAAVDAFLASLSAKLPKVGKGRSATKRRHKSNPTHRRTILGGCRVPADCQPRWKFTEFCNSAVSDRLEALFEEDTRLEAAFNLWLQERIQAADQE
jgi:hypothetical protein